MADEKSLAENIDKKTDELVSSLKSIHSDDIGYIKLFAISGSVLPILFAFLNGTVGLVILTISYILILLALKKVDNLSKNTKSYKYMIISLIAYMSLGAIYIFTLAPVMSGYYNTLDRLLSHYFVSFSFALIMALVSSYFYYKSYVEVAKATGLKIFKIAAILMIVGSLANFISGTLSFLLSAVAIVFIIIGWYGIKKIPSIDEENVGDLSTQEDKEIE
jgi:uncharacterized membrane protein